MFALEEPVRLRTFMEVVDQRPGHAVIALNAPIGYLNSARAGGRTCDQEARLLLGRRGGSVKSAPIRLESTREIDLLPDHLDAISRTLLPRYREVASEMAPFRQRTIYEVNPDLSFFQLNNERPMKWSKRSVKGVEERRRLLERRLQGVQRVLDASVLAYSSPTSWTRQQSCGRRVGSFTRASIRVPVEPQWDDQGLRMELVR